MKKDSEDKKKDDTRPKSEDLKASETAKKEDKVKEVAAKKKARTETYAKLTVAILGSIAILYFVNSCGSTDQLASDSSEPTVYDEPPGSSEFQDGHMTITTANHALGVSVSPGWNIVADTIDKVDWDMLENGVPTIRTSANGETTVIGSIPKDGRSPIVFSFRVCAGQSRTNTVIAYRKYRVDPRSLPPTNNWFAVAISK